MSLPPIENITTSNQLTCLPDANLTLTPIIWRFEYQDAAPEVFVVELLIYLTALVWNLFIVVYMVFKRKKLKDPPTMLLFTLGLIDLAAALITAPFYLSTVLRGEWYFGEDDCTRQSVCKSVGFMLSFVLLFQTNMIAAMSFDRFLAIVKPLHYSKYLTWQRTILIVLAAFFFSLLPCITPLFGFGVFFFEGRLGACLFRWTGQTSYVIFFITLLLIPITIISVFTVITYWKIRVFLKNRFHHHTRRFTVGSVLSCKQRRYNASQRNLLWLFTTLLAILALCWSPGIVTAIVSIGIGTHLTPGPVFLVALLCVLCNIAANPITAAIFIKDIRLMVIKIFRTVCCFWCCCPESCRKGNSHPARSGVARSGLAEVARVTTAVLTINGVQPLKQDSSEQESEGCQLDEDSNSSDQLEDVIVNNGSVSSNPVTVSMTFPPDDSHTQAQAETHEHEEADKKAVAHEGKSYVKRAKVSWSPDTDEGFESETKL